MKKVFSLIKSDLSAFRKGTPPGWMGLLHVLLFNAPFKAIMLYRFSHHFRMKGWKLLARILAYRCRVKYSIDISPMASIGERFRISHGVGTVIGGNTVIGSDCLVFHGVTFGIIAPEKSSDVRYPKIDDFVTVYAGALVLGGVHIEKNAVIAANSVATKDVPANTIVGGIPAIVLSKN